MWMQSIILIDIGEQFLLSYKDNYPNYDALE